jgi:hypothetical protein
MACHLTAPGNFTGWWRNDRNGNMEVAGWNKSRRTLTPSLDPERISSFQLKKFQGN